MNVLVIGAGPTGLTAALALTAAGVPCRIVERRTAPSELSRAVGIIPVTIDLLKPLGAAQAIVDEAMPIREVKLTRDGKPLMHLKNMHAESEDRVMRGLPQNRTEEILRDVLAENGVEVEYGVSACGITSDAKQATVTFSDGGETEFDWVIAADGIGSTTREQLGIAYAGYDLPDEWSIADVDVAGEFNSESVMLDAQASGGAFAMVLPIERQRARFVSSTPEPLERQIFPVEIANIRRKATFTISVRQAEVYCKGRILLAGDAAHCHSPMGGKGMNLGMDDAVAAVNAILGGNVASYSETRHCIGRRIIKLTERGRRIATSDGLAAKLVVTLATQAVSKLPAARMAFIRALANL